MLELLTNPDAWIALATLTLLEIVLGIDNIIFISILVTSSIRLSKLVHVAKVIGFIVTYATMAQESHPSTRSACLTCLKDSKPGFRVRASVSQSLNA